MYVPLGGPAFITVLVILGTCGIVTIGLKIAISASDHSVKEVLDPNVERLSDLQLANPPPPGTKPCSYCRIFVPISSRHCSTCDKCTPNFDHHCRWLNSCIGERNYKLFFVFMVAAWVSIFMTFVSAVYLLAVWVPNFDAIGDRLREVYSGAGGGIKGYDIDGIYNGNSGSPGKPRFGDSSSPDIIPGENNTGLGVMWMVLVIAGALLALLGLAGLAHLLRYHIRLIRDGETTYERIKRRRDEKRTRGTYVRRQDGCCGVAKRRKYPPLGAAGFTSIAENEPAYTSSNKGGANAPSATNRSAFAVEMVAVQPRGDDEDDEDEGGVTVHE